KHIQVYLFANGETYLESLLRRQSTRRNGHAEVRIAVRLPREGLSTQAPAGIGVISSRFCVVNDPVFAAIGGSCERASPRSVNAVGSTVGKYWSALLPVLSFGWISRSSIGEQAQAIDIGAGIAAGIDDKGLARMVESCGAF